MIQGTIRNSLLFGSKPMQSDDIFMYQTYESGYKKQDLSVMRFCHQILYNLLYSMHQQKSTDHREVFKAYLNILRKYKSIPVTDYTDYSDRQELGPANLYFQFTTNFWPWAKPSNCHLSRYYANGAWYYELSVVGHEPYAKLWFEHRKP